MRTDPIIEVDDLEFVAFVRECESIQSGADPRRRQAARYLTPDGLRGA